MKPTRLTPGALRDLIEAASWYEGQQIGLSDRFLEEFENQLAFIRDHPLAFPVTREIKKSAVRRALFPRFPYAVVFLERDTEIRIIAVAHHKRRPGYWLHRLRGEPY
jgi:toxin ParE1/3/4